MSNRYDEIYDDLCVTMQKYAVDKIAVLLGANPNLQYFDWDTVSEANEMPDTDLLGPAGIGMTDEGKFFHVLFSFGVAVKDDPNLFRLRKIASSVYADFRPETVLPVYRHADGLPVSWMQVTPPVTVSPIVRAASRPLIFVTGSAMLDPSAPLRP